MSDPSRSAPTPTEIPREARYQLSQPVLHYVNGVKLSLHGLRLLHAILHVTCRKVPDWHRLAVDQPEEGDWRACIELRRVLGFEGSNCNRSIATGVAELQASGLFDWIALLEGNRDLTWRLRDGLFAMNFETTPYGLLDIRKVATFSRAVDLRVYAELAVVRRMRQPQMALSIPACAGLLDRAPEWHRMRNDVVLSIQRSIEIFGGDCLALLERRRPGRSVDTITIRLRCNRRSWDRDSFVACPAEAKVKKVLLIDPQRCRDLKPSEVPAAAPDFFGWPSS